MNVEKRGRSMIKKRLLWQYLCWGHLLIMVLYLVFSTVSYKLIEPKDVGIVLFMIAVIVNNYETSQK